MDTDQSLKGGGSCRGYQSPSHLDALADKTHTITGGRFGGVAGAAANPRPQLRTLVGQGGELAEHQLDLLLLGVDRRSDAGWSFNPLPFWTTSRKGVNHTRSQPEMHPEIKLPSRVQLGRCSPRAVKIPEQVLGRIGMVLSVPSGLSSNRPKGRCLASSPLADMDFTENRLEVSTADGSHAVAPV